MSNKGENEYRLCCVDFPWLPRIGLIPNPVLQGKIQSTDQCGLGNSNDRASFLPFFLSVLGFCFEPGSQDGLELATRPTLTSNSWPCCYSLLSSGITDVLFHCVWPLSSFLSWLLSPFVALMGRVRGTCVLEQLKNQTLSLGVMVHAFSLSTWEAEAGGSL